MDTLVHIQFILSAFIIYIIGCLIVDYIKQSRHQCGMCNENKHITTCCKDSYHIIKNPMKGARDMKVCNECGRYSKTMKCFTCNK